MKKIIAAFLCLITIAVSSGAAEAYIKIVEVSDIPDPATAPYPDSYYTVECDLLFNPNPKNSIPQKFIAAVPGFLNRKTTSLANIKAGEIYLAELELYRNIPKAKQSVMQSDDLQRHDLELFFMEKAAKSDMKKVQSAMRSNKPVQANKKNSAPAFHGITYSSTHAKTPANSPYKSIYSEVLNPPLPEKAARMRAADMAETRDFLTKEIAKTAGHENELQNKFSRLFGSKNFTPTGGKGGSSAIIGEGYFRASGRSKIFYDVNVNKNFTAGIEAVNRILKHHNIQLIVVIVPNSDMVAQRVMVPEIADVIDKTSAQFVLDLIDRDIEGVYVTDDLIKAAQNYPFMFFYFNNDRHPGFGAVDVMTKVAAKKLADRFGAMSPFVGKDKFLLTDGLTLYGEDYRYPNDYPAPKTGETILCENILFEGKPFTPDTFRADSSILVLGNSYSQTPMAYGSFPAAMAMNSGTMTDYFYHRGSGIYSMLTELLLGRDTLLKGKKVVVWPICYVDFSCDFVNLEDFDREKVLLEGRRPIGKVAFDSLGQATAPEKNSDYNQVKNSLDRISKKEKPLVVKLAKASETFTFLLPSGVDKAKSSVLVMESALQSGQELSFSIDGKLENVYSHNRPQKHQIVLEIPANSQKFNLTVTAKKPDTLFGIFSMQIYQ